MLNSAKQLRQCKVAAADGRIGRIKDLYFDEERWTVRALLVDTEEWLVRRSVLISPAAVRSVDTEAGQVVLQLSKQQVRDSPESDSPQAGPSVADATGSRIDATDGRIGKVEDFLLDEDTWMVCFLVIDTRTWIPGKHVLVAPDWVEQVSWSDRTVAVALNQRTIRNSPEFTDVRSLTEHDEDALYAYYASSTAPHEQPSGSLRSANITRPIRWLPNADDR